MPGAIGTGCRKNWWCGKELRALMPGARSTGGRKNWWKRTPGIDARSKKHGERTFAPKYLWYAVIRGDITLLRFNAFVRASMGLGLRRSMGPNYGSNWGATYSGNVQSHSVVVGWEWAQEQGWRMPGPEGFFDPS